MGASAIHIGNKRYTIEEFVKLYKALREENKLLKKENEFLEKELDMRS